ncbi:alpha/beta hydrolase [Pelagibacterium sp.]|uniref:alpha/beta hydrolase n=1 Tax=Pelagibacterium sp. TaxID=1967288 RepID=UPI003A908206
MLDILIEGWMNQTTLRLVGGLVLASLLLYVLLVTVAYTFQREMVFPRRFVNATPFAAMVGADFERVTLDTSDGEKLKAYFKPPINGAPMIVAFHGNGSVPEPQAVRFGSAPWANTGFGILSFAYRGYPGSTGTPSEDGLLIDAEAAIAYAQKHAPGSPLVFVGHSLGTGVAVAMSERYPSQALVLEAPFSSLPDVVAATMPFLPGQLMQDTFFSARRIAGSQADSIIVVHGERDTVVPAFLGRRLFAAAPHGVFISVEDADHLNLRGMRDTEIVKLVLNGYPPQPTPQSEPVGSPDPLETGAA